MQNCFFNNLCSIGKKSINHYILGIGEGVTFPAISSFWGKWAPPNERARLAAVSFSGAQFGTIISMPLSGVICQYWGWPVMFYIFGGVSWLWVVAWFIFARNTPEDYATIDPLELNYIREQLPRSCYTKCQGVCFSLETHNLLLLN